MCDLAQQKPKTIFFMFNPKNTLLRKKDISIPILQMRNQGTER